MTADIDREKLRELCERATPGPWVPLKGWPDRIVPATHVARSPGASASEDEDRDNYALVICRAEHNDYSGFAHEIQESEAIANASFIAAARTALPALLDLTDAQAAKIAELEAENERLRRSYRCYSCKQVFEEDDGYGLAKQHFGSWLNGDRPKCEDCLRGTAKWGGGPHDPFYRIRKEEYDSQQSHIASLESERDQLRKQVEGQFVAGMRKAAEIANDTYETYRACSDWDYGAQDACVALDRAILSVASALEQKEQG